MKLRIIILCTLIISSITVPISSFGNITNSSETNEISPNIEETILFNDDFNDNSIDSSKWTVNGDVIESDGKLCITRSGPNTVAKIAQIFTGSFEIDLNITLEKIEWNDNFHGIGLKDSTGNEISFGFSKYDKFYMGNLDSGGSGSYAYGSPHLLSTQYQWKLVKNDNWLYIHVDENEEFAVDISHMTEELTIEFPGLYNDGDGGGSGETKSCIDFVTVTGVLLEPPVAQFTVDKPSVPVDGLVRFSDQSSGPASSWVWDFGDGETSQEQHPTHVYSKLGNYSITLTVANGMGDDKIILPNYIGVFELLNEVWVDSEYLSDTANDGHIYGFNAWNTIQDGIDSLSDFGLLHLGSGTYYPEEYNRNQNPGYLVIKDKSIIIDGKGLSNTIIQGNHDTLIFYIIQSDATYIKDLTIKDGGNIMSNTGGGILLIDSNITLENVRITDNEAVNGGAIWGETDGGGPTSFVTIKNSLIDSNLASNYGGAIISTGAIYSSTIVNNNAGSINELGGSAHTLRINNSIIWGSGSASKDHLIEYSNIESCDAESTNICSDPLFLDAANNDFMLNEASPAFIAGMGWRDTNGTDESPINGPNEPPNYGTVELSTNTNVDPTSTKTDELINSTTTVPNSDTKVGLLGFPVSFMFFFATLVMVIFLQRRTLR